MRRPNIRDLLPRRRTLAVVAAAALQAACLGLTEETDTDAGGGPTAGASGSGGMSSERPDADTPTGGGIRPPTPDLGAPPLGGSEPPPVPDAGPPAGCRDDADCGPDAMCDRGTGDCVPRAGCTRDADCGADALCLGGACTPPLGPCANDRDCPEGTLCEGGTCVREPVVCETDRDCPEPTICVDALCVEGVPCGGDVCLADEICQDGACVPAPNPGECASDRDCDPGRICVDGTCTDAPPPECRADGDCGAGEVCQGGVCVSAPPPPECAQDVDCAGNEVCRDGVCVPDLPGCLDDNDCGAGLVCTQGVCVPAPNECRVDGDCPAGQICANGDCVVPPPECVRDADCGAGRVCSNGVCAAPPPECVRDADCGAGRRCQAGACVPAGMACDSDLDCAAGSVCLNAVCSAPVGAAPRACNPRAAAPGCADSELCIPTQACAADAVNCRGVCAPSTCDACTPSDACGGAASTCLPGRPAAFCAPAGAAAEGGPCSIDDALYCQAGLTCLYGVCRRPCGGAACGAGDDTCPAGQACRDYSGSNGGNPLPLCAVECDTNLQRGCAAGEACVPGYYDAASDRQIGTCDPAGPSGRLLQNQVCAPSADYYWGTCRADHLCTDALTPGRSICYGTCTLSDLRNCTGASGCALGTNEADPSLGFCIGDCNVWGGAPGCGAGSVCQLAAIATNAAGVDVFTGLCAAGAANLALGDFCSVDAATGGSDCPVGSACLDTGDIFGPTCAQLCDTTPGAAHACPAGQSCTVNLFGQDRARGVSPNLGVCQ